MADALEMNWQPPRWVRYPKHLPIKGIAWSEVVKSSAGRHARSRYGPHPTINEAVIESLELLAVGDSESSQSLPEGAARGQLPSPQSNVRAYWIRLPFVIGASEGQETRYAFVMRSPDGDVHGYPLRRERLIARGMPENA